MQTSSFAQNADHPDAVAISLTVPPGYRGRRCQKLAPRRDMLRMSRTEYTPMYLAQLDHLDPRALLEELGENAVLLCFERPGQFCHRRLVAEWLEEKLGIVVPEFREQGVLGPLLLPRSLP